MITRRKIGTALDAKVIRFLHRRSRSTGKPVNRLIEEAVLGHPAREPETDGAPSLRLQAWRGFIGQGPRLPRRVVDEILAEDPFSQ